MRKICVVTGTRADYGLLFWLMKEIQDDPDLHLQVIATGMHLSPEFGLTVRQIEADGFPVDARVEMLLSSDTPVGITKSLGLGVIGFADALALLAPDIVVVLGDRFEILAAAQSAMIARIPLAHLHGGEATEGLIDEPIRHAVTKMAHFHFVIAEPYRRRVIQLGEAPERVFTVGAPGLDHLRRLPLLDRAVFEASIDFPLGDRSLLVTYHPVTLDPAGPALAMEALLSALDRFPEARILFTRSNADTDGRRINQMIDAYVAASGGRAKAFTTLGQQRYLSALTQVNAVVGNSSSGIIEAPSIPVPTVNLGERQRGRLRAASVIDCVEEEGAIASALERALSPAFRASLQGMASPFGTGEASVRIKETLKTVALEGVLMKTFYDLEDPR